MTFYTPAFISDQFPLPSFLHSHFRVQLHPPSTFHKYSHLCDLTYASHSFGVFFPHTSILSFLYLAYFHIYSPFIYLLFEVFLQKHQISLVAWRVENLPAVPETWVRSLDQEDPMEKGMATHSRILAWRIPWIEEPGRLYNPWGHKESDMTERLSLSKNTQYINWLLPHNSFLPQHIYLYYYIHIFEINSISTSTYTPKLRAAYFWSPIFLTTQCLYTGGEKKLKYQSLSHVQLNSLQPHEL